MLATPTCLVRETRATAVPSIPSCFLNTCEDSRAPVPSPPVSSRSRGCTDILWYYLSLNFPSQCPSKHHWRFLPSLLEKRNFSVVQSIMLGTEYHVGHSGDMLLSSFANNYLWCEETHTGATLTKRRSLSWAILPSTCLSRGPPGVW